MCIRDSKKPLREWPHALPRLQNHSFKLSKSPRACFWGYKKPLREWPHTLPGFGQVLVSNPGLEPGSSGVRRPRASPLGNLTTVGHGMCRPRASPLGNLTTVGHLAKVSPHLSLHFQTQKPRFLTSFIHKSHIFSTHLHTKAIFLTSFQQRKNKFSEA